MIFRPMRSRGCQSQPLDSLLNGSERLSRDRHFRHLEDYLPGMEIQAKQNVAHLGSIAGAALILPCPENVALGCL